MREQRTWSRLGNHGHEGQELRDRERDRETTWEVELGELNARTCSVNELKWDENTCCATKQKQNAD